MSPCRFKTCMLLSSFSCCLVVWLARFLPKQVVICPIKELDRTWGICGSYYNIPKAMFYILTGGCNYQHAVLLKQLRSLPFPVRAVSGFPLSPQNCLSVSIGLKLTVTLQRQDVYFALRSFRSFTLTACFLHLELPAIRSSLAAHSCGWSSSFRSANKS